VEYCEEVDHNLKAYKSNLYKKVFQNRMMKQAQYKSRQCGFTEELNTYEDIIGFYNGVLLLGNQPWLIQGFNEYKISKFTTIDYPYPILQDIKPFSLKGRFF